MIGGGGVVVITIIIIIIIIILRFPALAWCGTPATLRGAR
jgi:hypothetical protein